MTATTRFGVISHGLISGEISLAIGAEESEFSALWSLSIMTGPIVVAL